MPSTLSREDSGSVTLNGLGTFWDREPSWAQSSSEGWALRDRGVVPPLLPASAGLAYRDGSLEGLSAFTADVIHFL